MLKYQPIAPEPVEEEAIVDTTTTSPSDERFDELLNDLGDVFKAGVNTMPTANTQALAAAKQIHEVGLSRSNYQAVKQVHPAFLGGINAKELSDTPSEQHRGLAIESLNEMVMSAIAGLVEREATNK